MTVGLSGTRSRLLLTTSGIAVFVLMPPKLATAEPVTVTADVVKIVDGDTIDVRDDIRGHLRIRVLGIDTPETVDPKKTVGCWGPEATTFAKTNLVGHRVALVIDPTQDAHDKYGRTLAYIVKSDGWDYSIEAARAGNSAIESLRAQASSATR